MIKRIVVHRLTGLRTIVWTEDLFLKEIQAAVLPPEITIDGTDRFRLAVTRPTYHVYQEYDPTATKEPHESPV
jgi:hypothetical protein